MFDIPMVAGILAHAEQQLLQPVAEIAFQGNIVKHVFTAQYGKAHALESTRISQHRSYESQKTYHCPIMSFYTIGRITSPLSRSSPVCFCKGHWAGSQPSKLHAASTFPAAAVKEKAAAGMEELATTH